jgi:hypothetical protein
LGNQNLLKTTKYYKEAEKSEKEFFTIQQTRIEKTESNDNNKAENIKFNGCKTMVYEMILLHFCACLLPACQRHDGRQTGFRVVSTGST